MKDAEGVPFLQWCLPRLRLRWSGYRKVRRQVYKRISTRLQLLGLHSLDDYRSYLEAHPEEWHVLDSSCWISISRFYRDKSVFQFLAQEVLPALARQTIEDKGILRCWSIGCAGGEEPYSLSLLWRLKLQAQFPTMRLIVLATDVDNQALSRAQKGCYSFSSLKDLPESWCMQGFDHVAERCSSIKPEFRDPVTFLEQDIRHAMPGESFHLILCRYLVFTYFDAPLQSIMLRQLVEQMHSHGALIIGKGERLPDGKFGLIPWSQKEGVYKKKESIDVHRP